MRLRYAGTCARCGVELAARATAVYDRASRTVSCVTCPIADSTPDEVDASHRTVEIGTAGASARREYERRSARRETRVREAHPVIGGLILALSDEPQSTRAWAAGARGEQRLGAALDSLTERGVRVLHDRRIPGSKANIDHIAVGPSGVFVLDAKRYRGRPDLRVDGGLLRPRTTRLMVGSRDCTRLVEGMHKQVGLVREAMLAAGFGHVGIEGLLCFVEADWPLVGGSFTIDGVSVLWPKKAAQRVSAAGDLAVDTVEAIHHGLARAFPIA